MISDPKQDFLYKINANERYNEMQKEAMNSKCLMCTLKVGLNYLLRRSSQSAFVTLSSHVSILSALKHSDFP